MSAIAELFGRNALDHSQDWGSIVASQACPFTARQCYKVRKSDPGVSIGTCTVRYGKHPAPVVICPERFTVRRQVFTDCLHLLAEHEPGNELHIVSEVPVPGGSVDYCLVSVKSDTIADFVGVELQALDTTGTVWPERQQLLRTLGLSASIIPKKAFGMNWKHTAKTTLIQLHHKIQTFEHLGKKLVLVAQDRLLDYMAREFDFSEVQNPPSAKHSMHFHAYQFNSALRLSLARRMGTDMAGVAHCLGLQADARISLAEIVEVLRAKVSDDTLFAPAKVSDDTLFAPANGE